MKPNLRFNLDLNDSKTLRGSKPMERRVFCSRIKNTQRFLIVHKLRRSRTYPYSCYKFQKKNSYQGSNFCRKSSKVCESFNSKLNLRFSFTVKFYPRKYIHSKNYYFKFSRARKMLLQKYEPYDKNQLNP